MAGFADVGLGVVAVGGEAAAVEAGEADVDALRRVLAVVKTLYMRDGGLDRRKENQSKVR